MAHLTDSVGKAEGRNPSGLGADDVACSTLTPCYRILQDVLWHLRGLPAPCKTKTPALVPFREIGLLASNAFQSLQARIYVSAVH
jgi:hypothetical protein